MTAFAHGKSKRIGSGCRNRSQTWRQGRAAQGPEAQGLGGLVALPRPPVSTEPQQWQRIPTESAQGSPRPSVPQK